LLIIFFFISNKKGKFRSEISKGKRSVVFILEGHNCRDWHGVSLALTKFLPTASLSGAKKVGHMVVGPSKTLGEVVSVFDS